MVDKHPIVWQEAILSRRKRASFSAFSAVEVVFEHDQKGVENNVERENVGTGGGLGGWRPARSQTGPPRPCPKFRAPCWWLGALVVLGSLSR
jgi:hypothetical protein